LATGIKYGLFWEVERINNQMFYTELATLAEKYNFENVEVDFENIEYHTKGTKEIIIIRATRYNAQYEKD
jgi:chitinase